MSQIFKLFGPLLEDKETETKFFKPENLKAKNDFNDISIVAKGGKMKQNKYIRGASEQDDLDSILKGSWAFKLTESNINKRCIICKTGHKIEMHHLRNVADVRAKWRSGNTTFEERKGAMLRKQIPLCQYHHQLYHSGQLNYQDIQTIYRFK